MCGIATRDLVSINFALCVSIALVACGDDDSSSAATDSSSAATDSSSAATDSSSAATDSSTAATDSASTASPEADTGTPEPPRLDVVGTARFGRGDDGACAFNEFELAIGDEPARSGRVCGEARGAEPQDFTDCFVFGEGTKEDNCEGGLGEPFQCVGPDDCIIVDGARLEGAGFQATGRVTGGAGAYEGITGCVVYVNAPIEISGWVQIGGDPDHECDLVPPEPEPPDEVVCGGETCDPALARLGTPLCCTAEDAQFPDACGTDVGAFVPELEGQCLALNQPGDPDPSCPEFAFPGNVGEGCCTVFGVCGAIESSVGLGCVYDPRNMEELPCGE